MKKYISVVLLSLSIFASCAEYTPKPRAYPRAYRPQAKDLHKYVTPAFTMYYPSDAIIVEQRSLDERQHWFNLSYTNLNATFYFSYTSMTNRSLQELLNDNEHFVYNPTTYASMVDAVAYEDSLKSVYGILYSIKDAVSPIQFYLTDNTTHFLRGSLFYDVSVSADSVRQTTQSIEADIVNLMESLSWNWKK